jgi:hypothetical protein
LSDSTNKISLAGAHAALDALALAHAAPPNLLAQVTPEPAPIVVEVPPVSATVPDIQAAVSAAQSASTDLLTIVRAKLNRVAVEFGIDYALVRDFFTSHL